MPLPRFFRRWKKVHLFDLRSQLLDDLAESFSGVLIGAFPHWRFDKCEHRLQRRLFRDDGAERNSCLGFGIGITFIMPEIVVVPGDVAQVAAVIKLAKEADVPIVPRGSGTGLAGGAVPAEGGIILSLARLNRILKIDFDNRIALVEPGVINLDVTKAISKDGFFYAPDPSSQAACSIGGNVANNSGGPHTLAYGVTTNHVLGMRSSFPLPRS